MNPRFVCGGGINGNQERKSKTHMLGRNQEMKGKSKLCRMDTRELKKKKI